MARCPFAEWTPIPQPAGRYVPGARWKILHHTTEGSTAGGAFAAYRAKKCAPHFTVQKGKVYQHVDTSVPSRALLNRRGGVETNRLRVIQIEVVGFAGRPKDRETLASVARLCRWIEETRGVPREWPAGLPKVAVSGSDPGGHRRDVSTWLTRGGHYGHSQVPENLHWDPAYTADEVALIMGWEPTPTRTPITLYIETNEIPDAAAYLEAGTSWSAVRAMLEDLELRVMVDGERCVLTRYDQTLTLPCRTENGRAFVKCADLRGFRGIAVEYDDETRSVKVST